jgi:hypothetical protein
MMYQVTIGEDGKSISTRYIEAAPEALEDNEYVVEFDEAPDFLRFVLEDGEVRPMTTEEVAEEIEAMRVVTTERDNRATRDRLLAETDWMVIKATEAGEAVPANVVTYRQALRDMPEHTEWPLVDENDWPTAP